MPLIFLPDKGKHSIIILIIIADIIVALNGWTSNKIDIIALYFQMITMTYFEIMKHAIDNFNLYFSQKNNKHLSTKYNRVQYQ